MAKGLPRSLSRGAAQDRPVIKQRLTISETVTVTAVSTAIGFGSAVISDFEEGNVLLLGCVATLAFAGSGSDANLADDWSGDFGIGSTPASDATITGADVDILASQALDTASSEAHASARYADPGVAIIDNTDGSAEMNLNLLIDAADITDDESVDITVTGYVDIVYTMIGDD
jgi:hypothetical protein